MVSPLPAPYDVGSFLLVSCLCILSSVGMTAVSLAALGPSCERVVPRDDGMDDGGSGGRGWWPAEPRGRDGIREENGMNGLQGMPYAANPCRPRMTDGQPAASRAVVGR